MISKCSGTTNIKGCRETQDIVAEEREETRERHFSCGEKDHQFVRRFPSFVRTAFDQNSTNMEAKRNIFGRGFPVVFKIHK